MASLLITRVNLSKYKGFLRLIWKRDSSSLAALSQPQIDRLVQKYEDFIGLTEVKGAQNSVIEAEAAFLNQQQERQKWQAQLIEVQRRLKGISFELEKLHRSDDRYLKLITEEHEIIKQEEQLTNNLETAEDKERQLFTLMSHSLRDSHEKERTQSERTKYWSIAGSCLGALLGIVGTSLNNHRKITQLKQLFAFNIEEAKQHTDNQMNKMTESLTELKTVVTENLELSSPVGQAEPSNIHTNNTCAICACDNHSSSDSMELSSISKRLNNLTFISAAFLAGYVIIELFLR